MSSKSPATSRQELLSVIESIPETDLPKLLQLVQNFHQKNILDSASYPEQIDISQLEWQQAIDTINLQDKDSIDRKKANISQLIAKLNQDDDIEEQQKTLEIINSIADVSI